MVQSHTWQERLHRHLLEVSAKQRRERFLGIEKKPSTTEKIVCVVVLFFEIVVFSILLLCLVPVEFRPWSVLELFSLATFGYYVAPFCYKRLKRSLRGRAFLRWLGMNPFLMFMALSTITCVAIRLSSPEIEVWRYVGAYACLTFIGLILQLIVWSSNHVDNHPELYGFPSLRKPLHAGVSKGIGVPAKRTVKLLPGNALLPLRQSTSFKTFEDDQEIVFLNFFFGEEENRVLVGEYMVSNIPKSAKGSRDYNIQITIEEDRKLKCTVEEPLVIIYVIS